VVVVASGKIIALVVGLIVVIVVAGLAVYYYDAYNKLTFELKSVSVGDISLSSIQITLRLQITNPNALSVYIPDGSFDIYVNDIYLGAGTFGALTINGNSQEQITVPVTFNASDVPSVFYGLITGGGTVTVTVKGQANLVLLSVPFESTLYNVTIGQ
jgi:LEA14-like dessication related protein